MSRARLVLAYLSWYGASRAARLLALGLLGTLFPTNWGFAVATDTGLTEYRKKT